MFARPPREPEWLSWLFVGLWTAFIYLSIPYVRVVVRYFAEHYDRTYLLYGVGAIGLCLAALAINSLRKRPQAPIGAYVWLIAATAAFLAYTASLSSNPEEAVHFVEYGALSLLLYRAFSHRVRDSGIYGLAAIAGALVGMFDEGIQWLVPGRVWDVRDIALNTSAVALVQITIWQGIRPQLIARTPSGKRVRQICRFAALAVAFLGLCFINTPQRISLYAARIAPLSHLGGPGGTMVEYGYLIEDPEIGIFRSRLTREALREQDERRATEGAEILDSYADRESYGDFLRQYTVVQDPFLHEARVHLFRRDAFLGRAERAQDAGLRRDNITVAYWENRIMEQYFPNVLGRSGYVWSPDLREQVEQEAERSEPYESAVSRTIVTRLSEAQALWLFILSIIALLIVGEVFGRKAAANS